MSKLIKIETSVMNIIANIYAIKNELDTTKPNDKALYEQLNAMELDFISNKRDYFNSFPIDEQLGKK